MSSPKRGDLLEERKERVFSACTSEVPRPRATGKYVLNLYLTGEDPEQQLLIAVTAGIAA